MNHFTSLHAPNTLLKSLLLGGLTLVLAAPALPARTEASPEAQAQRAERNAGHGFGRRLERRQEARHDRFQRMARAIGVSDAQREQFRLEARAVRPSAEALRLEAGHRIRAGIERVRKGEDRAAVRAEVKQSLLELRAQALRDVEPSARRLAATITPEQRHKLEALATKHGRTFDEARFTERLGRALLRTRGEQRTEKRTQERTQTRR